MSTHVFEAMGTTASIRFDGARPDFPVLEAIESCFARFDEQFSLYRRDSEISRIARGELSLPDSSESFRDMYAEALYWRGLTHDSFTPHRPDGVLDLSGLVKAKAIDEAAHLLSASRATDWLLNVGGDLVADGSFAGIGWRVGVVDPDDRQKYLCLVDLEPGRTSVATSGTAERGEHVWRGTSLAAYRQVTVVASDIVTADVLATAILAGGPERRDQAIAEFGVEVITFDAAGDITATDGVRGSVGFESPPTEPATATLGPFDTTSKLRPCPLPPAS